MATQFSDDDINFEFYMNLTDVDHKVRSATEYAGDVYRYFHEQGPMKGAQMPWSKTASHIRFRPHEVTVWGGYNGHGKSLVLGQIINGFTKEDIRTCIASLEMRPHLTLARMCRQASGSIPSKEFIEAYHESTDGLLWMYDQQGTVKGDKMIAVIRYAADKFKVQHFIVDSLMKCGFGEDDYNGQKEFVDQLCAVARDTGVHIHLVHHSRKGKDEYAPPGKHDMKGTGAIIDQVDNLVIVWRNKKKEEVKQANNGMAPDTEPDAMLIVEKQRNGEWEGKIGLWFDELGRGFVER
jgi:twinkle protein